MKKKTYWVGITNYENWKSIKKTLEFGVKENFFKKIKRVNKGDEILFYILGKKIGGIFKVNSGFYYAENKIFENFIYPFRIKLKTNKIIEKIFTKELIKKLYFIKNKIKWGGSFQGKAIIEIEKRDFNELRSYLKNEKI